MGVPPVRDVALADARRPDEQRRDPLRRVLEVVAVLVERDDRERTLRPPRGRAHDGAELGGEEVVARLDPAALHVGAVVRADPSEARRSTGAGEVARQRLKRQQVRRAVGRPFPHVSEVGHRLVVVPVVAVHGVVARPGGALQVRLPRLVRGADQVADVAGPDRVLGVLLERVGERDAERAAAGEREVVGVARVLLGVEVAEQAAAAEQAVEERRLPLVPDDRVQVLVLEVEQEHVLVTGDPRGWSGQRGPRGRGRDMEVQAVGRRVVVAGQGRVRSVVVPVRGGQDERDPDGGGARRKRSGRRTASQRDLRGRAADRPDGRVPERLAAC